MRSSRLDYCAHGGCVSLSTHRRAAPVSQHSAHAAPRPSLQRLPRGFWRERFLIILHALQSALVEPPTICCLCDALGIGSDSPLRGRLNAAAVPVWCSTLRPCPLGAQRCGCARGQLEEGRDAHHDASATSRRMSGAKQQAGLLRARWVRPSEYASKGSTSIAT